MTKLLTQNAAIKYLREICGTMSARTFQDEVRSGRIPQKPFGKKIRTIQTGRFRQMVQHNKRIFRLFKRGKIYHTYFSVVTNGQRIVDTCIKSNNKQNQIAIYFANRFQFAMYSSIVPLPAAVLYTRFHVSA